MAYSNPNDQPDYSRLPPGEDPNNWTYLGNGKWQKKKSGGPDGSLNPLTNFKSGVSSFTGGVKDWFGKPSNMAGDAWGNYGWNLQGLAGSIPGMYQQWGQDASDRAFEGGAKTRQALDPWRSYLQNTFLPGMTQPSGYENDFYNYGSDLMSPGKLDPFSRELKFKYTQPGEAKTAANDYNTWMTDNPSESGRVNEEIQRNFAGPSYGETNYESVRAETANPWEVERDYGQVVGMYDQSVQDAQNRVQWLENKLKEKGAGMEAAERVSLQAELARARLDAERAQVDAELGAIGALKSYEGEIAGTTRSADALADWQRGAGRSVDQATGLERFANQALATGSNPYMDREREKGLAALDQRLAARGGAFASGAAERSIGNYIAEDNAQRYKQMSDLLDRSGQMQLARQRLGSDVAAGVSKESLERAAGLQRLGTGLSEEQLGRQEAKRKSWETKLGADRGYLETMLGAGRLADDSEFKRLNLYNTMTGDMADIQQNAAAGISTAGLNTASGRSKRLDSGSMAAGKADDGKTSWAEQKRLSARSADDVEQSRRNGAVTAANYASLESRERDRILADVLDSVDDNKRAGVEAYLRSSRMLTDLKDGRLRDSLEAVAGLSKAEAQVVADTWEKANGAMTAGQGQGLEAMLELLMGGQNAELQSELMRAMGEGNWQKFILDLGKTGLTAAMGGGGVNFGSGPMFSPRTTSYGTEPISTGGMSWDDIYNSGRLQRGGKY